LSSTAILQNNVLQKNKLVRRIVGWLDAMPHAPVAVEISADRVAVARWGRRGTLAAYAVETLPPGALVPSAVDVNIANALALDAALASAISQIHAKGEDVTLLVPDPVVRVFVQHFEELPRSAQEAEPILRWKLKKSVPFDVEETAISYMRQPARQGGVDVVTALARQRIIREYEGLAEAAGLYPGVVLSSALAAVSLLDGEKATLLARVSGSFLTTAIVRDGVLCGYRCTELPAHGGDVSPQILLEEIFPLVAYFQDTWGENIDSVRIAGLGGRLPEFVVPLEAEFRCGVGALLHRAISEGRIPPDAQPLADREVDGLIGWMLHRR
jgi:type IV pilus assembly protein PilM